MVFGLGSASVGGLGVFLMAFGMLEVIAIVVDGGGF